MVKARRYFIDGRVQGVAFRYFVQRIANVIGISGYVRNLPDGRVEAFAQGEEANLQQFYNHIKNGPPSARVDFIDVEELQPDPRLHGFTIKF